MAKLDGPRVPLQDFRTPYSDVPKGRVFNLSASLVMQQNSDNNPPTTTDGRPFLSTGSYGISVPVSFMPGVQTGLWGLRFSTPNSKLLLPVGVADTLNFTTQGLTVSMWISGSTSCQNVNELTGTFRLQSSGTLGAQFTLGAVGTTSTSVQYSAAVVNTAGNFNIIASTTDAINKSSGDFLSIDIDVYRGRYKNVLTSSQGFTNSQLNIAQSGWKHIVYVQKAATNPTKLKPVLLLGANSHPERGISTTGDEGLCEMWLNGQKIYETPRFGPFPQGHAPYFNEYGIEGLSGDSLETFPGVGLGKNVLRQVGSTACISGSVARGDALAQLSIWRRALSPEEIKSIYIGTMTGVITDRVTSVSSAPKRLTSLSHKGESNVGFVGLKGKSNTSAFFDDTEHSLKVTAGIYQGVHQIDLLDSNLSSVIINDGTSRDNSAGSVSFKEIDEVTQLVKDEEFVIPSGSVAIRVSLTNENPYVTAGRYHSGSNDLLSDDRFSSAVGIPATAGFIGTGFLYYSPKLKTWIEKRADGITSKTQEPGYINTQPSATNFIEAETYSYTLGTSNTHNPTNYANKIMAQFAWSPQFGYFVNHVEHLRQVGYERIGWPTGFFGAPNAPKYHAYDHETIKLSDYIDKPFILKRIELKIPVTSYRKFGVNPNEDAPVGAGSGPGKFDMSGNSYERQITNKKDIDNYTFFVYRQRRVSRHKDEAEDIGTSMRYLVASASVCYFNSGSFGGAWSDEFFTQWPAGDSYNSLVFPSGTTDFKDQSLTRISGTNCILHNPQYIHDWGKERFYDDGTYLFSSGPGDNLSFITSSDSQTLRLTMYPTVLPICSVAPSLIPVTSSLFSQTETFANRDGTDPGYNSSYNTYMTSGTRGSLSPLIPAPFLTLVSQQWAGCTRPLQIHSTIQNDPFDTTTLNGSQFHPGRLDTSANYLPSSVYNITTEDQSVAGVTFSVTRAQLPFGQTQQYGISMTPAATSSTLFGDSAIPLESFYAQPQIDPSSVNASIVVPKQKSLVNYFGRISSTVDKNSWSIKNPDNSYMGELGWRFISSFQKSDYSEQQIYSPSILYPEDELIIGLDAGTFGPPDLDADTVAEVGDAYDATSTRFYKNTYLKEDYRKLLSDSFMKIRTGEAELILIGDFIADESPIRVSRAIQISGDVSSFYGETAITDQSYLFNADLMSGSMMTRVFTGPEGPTGVLSGERRFYRDAGARLK